LNETTNRMENGVVIFANIIKLPTGTQQVSLALAMLVILMARPAGLMGGRELGMQLSRRTRSIAKRRGRAGVRA
jgi:branched-chain amino acid transport system permease protein